MAEQPKGIPLDERIPFSDLCRLFRVRENETGSVGETLDGFIRTWRKGAKKGRDSFFPIMRLLLPQNDKARPTYNLKESSLAKLYVQACGLDKDSGAGKRIIEWVSPEQNGGIAGNFVRVIGNVLTDHAGSAARDNPMTICEVNVCLDELAKLGKSGMFNHRRKAVDSGATTQTQTQTQQTQNGTLGSEDEHGKKTPVSVLRAKIIGQFVKRLTADENRWIASIIVKASMKCGLGEKLVFKKYHEDAEYRWSHCQCLKTVCDDLLDKSLRLHQLGIELMVPFKPMLAERMEQPAKIWLAAKKNGEGMYCETKFDGERMQLHKRGREYKYFSRQGHDWSFAFGASATEGSFTKYVHDCFGNTDSCILDGEMMIWDPVTQSFLTMLQQGGCAHLITDIPDKNSKRPIFVVFDILALNGEVLTDEPLKARITRLKRGNIFKETTGTIVISQQKFCNSLVELETSIKGAVEDQEEGIIIKMANSKYTVDGRAKKGWIKWKPEYVDSLSDHLDLVVFGGYHGEGHRGGGGVSHFMLGAWNEEKQKWQSVCKVGSGYTKNELAELNRELGPKFKKFPSDKNKDPWKTMKMSAPAFDLAMPGYKERPDVWLQPEDSIVLEVKAAEIFLCDTFAAELTLRFPRVVKRREKLITEADKVEDLFKLFRTNSGKLTHGLDSEGGTASLNMESERSRKKRKTGGATGRSTGVLSSQRLADFSGIMEKSAIMEDYELVFDSCDLSEDDADDLVALCAMNDIMDHESKSSVVLLQQLAKMHGATVSMNFVSEKSFKYVIAEKYSYRVKNMVKTETTNSFDVVKPAWLLKTLRYYKADKPERRCFHYISEFTRSCLGQVEDRFGDSYTDDISPKALNAILSHKEFHAEGELTNLAMADLEHSLLHNNNLRFFRTCCLCFYKCRGEGGLVELAVEQARFYGAKLVDEIDDDVSHGVFVANDAAAIAELKQINADRLDRHVKLLRLVNVQWVLKSAEQRRLLLPQQGFEPTAASSTAALNIHEHL
eukprot:m.259884 g.259884  ORF g.259884 m.259884 type:complete len:1008 (-) comp38853_c0_seq1:68-3091(-)